MKRVILSNHTDKDIEHLMSMYGFIRVDLNEYINIINDETTAVVSKTNGKYVIDIIKTSNKKKSKTWKISDVEELIYYLDTLDKLFDIQVFSNTLICNSSERKQVISAAISMRDLTKNLVRVKSSNVWAYAINVRHAGDKMGDVLAQFKGKNGGPGDIYIYYNVPVTLYRRWIGAPSKGHFFWQYIRNNFQYSKLTGDQKGKLKNAVNRR